MEFKKFLLGAIFGLLILTAFLLGKNKKFNLKIQLPLLTRKEKELLFPELDTGKVNKIQIIALGKETLLEKENGDWQRREATVSTQKEKVDNLLETIKNFSREELASENPEKQDIFQVNQKGTEVFLKKDEEVLAHFFVGKRGPDFLSTYVRRDGENQVYLIKQNLSPIFNPSSWEE